MTHCENAILSILGDYLSSIMARSITTLCVSRAGVQLDALQNGAAERFLAELARGLSLYVEGAAAQRCCLKRVANALQGRHDSAANADEIISVPSRARTTS